MYRHLLAFSLLLLFASHPKPKSEDCRIALPGMSFTRSFNGAAARAKVENGKLTLTSEAHRDYFRDPEGTYNSNSSPILLAEVDNTRPFTFGAKMTPEFRKTYDAGALYIYASEDLWLKLAMEMDERNKTRMVTVRTIGTSDDNDHDVVETKNVYLKISSNTKIVGFYYSLDGKTWQLLRVFKNDYPARIWLGVSAQSPMGEGSSTVFEEFSLTTQSISDFRMGT